MTQCFPLVLMAAACAVSPGPAEAQDRAFSGFRVGAVAGVDETDSAPGRGAQSGFLYGAQVGYDRDLGGPVVGVEADILASQASTSEPGFSADADRYISGAVRLGYKLTPTLLGFARGGIGNARISTSVGDFDQTGFTVGGGAELAAFDPVFVRAEYRYSDYGSQLRGQQYLLTAGLRF